MSAAYPPASVAFRGRTTPSGGTAETLVLVAFILQVIGAAFLTFGALMAIAFSAFTIGPWTAAVVVGVLVLGLAAFAFLYVAYEYSYQRIRTQDYAGAQTPTLLIGIVSLFFGILPGILYLIGYLKLGDALREQQYPPLGYPAPYTAPPSAPVACAGCGRVGPAGTPFCASCGRKF